MKIQGKVLLALGSCIWALPAMAQDTQGTEMCASIVAPTNRAASLAGPCFETGLAAPMA